MPPFAEPSSFVSATPVTPTASLKRRACCSAVLAGRRVDDEQRLVRRALEPARDHAAHLRQLVHQVRLRVQAAGGVDDHDVRRAPARLDRVVGDRGRVAPALAADEVGAARAPPRSRAAPRPRRGTCRRRRAMTERPCSRELLRELADRRRLAGAVDADDEDHRSAAPCDVERARGSPKQRRRSPPRAPRSRSLELLRASSRRTSSAVARDADVAPGSAPPRAAPTMRRRSGSNAATASCSVSARRDLPSDSRRRPKRPRALDRRLGARSASPSSSDQLRAMRRGALASRACRAWRGRAANRPRADRVREESTSYMRQPCRKIDGRPFVTRTTRDAPRASSTRARRDAADRAAGRCTPRTCYFVDSRTRSGCGRRCSVRRRPRGRGRVRRAHRATPGRTCRRIRSLGASGTLVRLGGRSTGAGERRVTRLRRGRSREEVAGQSCRRATSCVYQPTLVSPTSEQLESVRLEHERALPGESSRGEPVEPAAPRLASSSRAG